MKRGSGHIAALFGKYEAKKFAILRFLLQQGLAFRGHDESEKFENKGNFLELLAWLAENNEDVSKIVKNAPRNCKLTSPMIQADIIECC